jgi:Protein of unknown function (DUF3224)
MTNKAVGTFEVSIKPVGSTEAAASGATLGRMSLDKQYSGGLVAKATGEMLTAMSAVKGSGSYVAVEKVTGTLDGRKGSFAFVHQGTMNRGAQQLSIAIVPDTGTDELTGITGRLLITITGGQHFYEVEYTLPQ